MMAKIRRHERSAVEASQREACGVDVDIHDIRRNRYMQRVQIERRIVAECGRKLQLLHLFVRSSGCQHAERGGEGWRHPAPNLTKTLTVRSPHR